MSVRTVTLDFWGTLVVDPPGSDDRYRQVRVREFAAILRAARAPSTIGILDRAYADSARFLSEVWARDRDVPVEEHVRAVLRGVEETLPKQLEGAVLEALVEAYARPALLLPPAVDESARGALTALRERGYVLAVVSNAMRTPGRTLRKILAHHGLLDCFAHTTFSDEVGVRKPAPSIFTLTLAAVGGEPATAVHVGDDDVLDVAGARGAGLRVIQVRNPRTRRGPAGPRPASAARPDLVIESLRDLPDAVARLDAAS